MAKVILANFLLITDDYTVLHVYLCACGERVGTRYIPDALWDVGLLQTSTCSVNIAIAFPFHCSTL